MNSFKVGDRVVCVNTEHGATGETPNLKYGAAYIVAGSCGGYLHFGHHAQHEWYDANRFELESEYNKDKASHHENPLPYAPTDRKIEVHDLTLPSPNPAFCMACNKVVPFKQVQDYSQSTPLKIAYKLAYDFTNWVVGMKHPIEPGTCPTEFPLLLCPLCVAPSIQMIRELRNPSNQGHTRKPYGRL